MVDVKENLKIVREALDRARLLVGLAGPHLVETLEKVERARVALDDLEVQVEDWRRRARRSSSSMTEAIVYEVRGSDGRPFATVEKRGTHSWCISRNGSVLANTGEWVYEPLPSSRTDEFIASTRFTLDFALDKARELARCNDA